MKINSQANQIRNMDIPLNKAASFGKKEEMLTILKEEKAYPGRDMLAQNEKRARRAKIRKEAGDNPEKIMALKETAYNEEEKRELELTCPYPLHKGYYTVWNRLNPKQQKKMKETIRITTDGKIEMIKMKKKFSMLTAKPNGKTILDENYRDKNWSAPIDNNIKWVTYMTGRAAQEQCEEQNKELLEGKAEVEQFISFFPWESIEEKLLNFISLFDLKEAGYLSWFGNRWFKSGYVMLSKTYKDEGGNEIVHGVKWSGNYASISRYHESDLNPFVAYEDC